MTPAEEKRWCENLWWSLADGGTWGVPRTGLVLQKNGGKKQLAVVTRAPDMPGQDEEITGLREKFASIGVEVVG